MKLYDMLECQWTKLSVSYDFSLHACNFCDFVDSNFGNYSGIVGLLKLHAGTGYVSQVNDAFLAH